MSPEDKSLRDLEQSAYNAGCSNVPFSQVLARVRKQWAEGLIRCHDGDKSAAARDGHVHRNTLNRMCGCSHE